VEIGPIAGVIPAGSLRAPPAALVDQLAREVDVGAVLEDHGDLRQAVARQRARLLQARQAGHHVLEREGDALLGFQRRIAGAAVLICTCTLVMSGTASMGSFW
jgi:hypothetical protein